jgi:peptide/nickel transport system permease protein
MAVAKPRRKVDWQFVTAIFIFGVFLVLAVYGITVTEAAEKVNVANTLKPPSAEHWFGTDNQGRDVFQRVAVGTWLAVASGTVAVVIGAALGLAVALTAGLGPRWADAVLMRISDAILAFPQFLLALAISMAFGAGLVTAVIAIIVTVIPVFARTLRGEAKRSRTEPFIDAARTIGLTTPHIAVRHVVPYVSTTLIVQAAANFGNVVLTLAGLSFIGVGAKPPTPEWGAMITDGLQNTLTGQWWIGVFPGMALLLLVIAVNMFADQLPSHVGRRRKAPAPVSAPLAVKGAA